MPCKGRWRDSPLVLGCGGVAASRFYTSEVICVGRVAVRAFAYARASTEEQASAALGLDARIASTDGSIDERGWVRRRRRDRRRCVGRGSPGAL